MKRAIYAASLDPITFGHIDIIERAVQIFDELVVAIGANPDKKYTFSLEERVDMARHSLAHIHNVRVTSFSGLLVDFAYEQRVDAIVKGVRDVKDFSYEQLLHQVGVSQKLGIETILLFARKDLEHVSSSVVKAIQKEQGFIHEYVPLCVKQRLEEKMSGQYMIGITGEIGAGKSYVGNLLVEVGKEKGIEVHNVEMDMIGHRILGELMDPVYVDLRAEIAETFGREVLKTDGFIDRKVLGEIVFNNPEKMKRLNKLMYTPLLARLRREIYGKKGMVLLNAALLVEFGLMHLCNNNFIFIKTDKDVQMQRLRKRGLSDDQIRHRLNSQYGEEEKRLACENALAGSSGKCIVIDNSKSKEGMKQDCWEIFRMFGIDKEAK